MPKNNATFLPADGYLKAKSARAVDMALGAQNGWMVSLENLDANEAYVKQDLISVLYEAPRGFQDLPNPDQWVRALKTLVEDTARRIEGLNSTLTAEFSETPFGGAGEVQHSVINMTRAPSTPTFTWDEKRGKPIQTFLEQWGLMLMMDPETKKAGVISLPGNEKKELDLSPSYRAATVLFIEPTADMRGVQNAWLCVNMMPKTFGENTGVRDLTAAKEAVEHSIEFTATTDCSRGTFEIAKKVLDSMKLTSITPQNRKEYLQGISADVDKVKVGILDRIEENSAKVYE